MKKIITLIFIFFANIVYSQELTNKKSMIMSVPCDTTNNVFSILTNGKEGLLFSGNGYILEATTNQFYPGTTMFFVNQNTGKWSIIISFGDGISCLLTPGNNFTPFSGNQPWDEEKDGL